MRVIKFRIWDPFNESMTVQSEAKTVSNILLKYELLQDGDNTPVLMQFTGCTDKNGVEIYEGDIVQYMDGDSVSSQGGYSCEEFQNIGIIEYYTQDHPHFNVTNRQSVDTEDVFGEMIVIGNIHQHPELLNESKTNREC